MMVSILLVCFVVVTGTSPVWAKPGDVSPALSPDGNVDVNDAVEILRMVLGIRADKPREANVSPFGSPDEAVDVNDAVVILQHVLGIIGEITVDGTSTQSMRSDYQYMNTLRTQAGLNTYIVNTSLEQAATNHANYLVVNGLQQHDENQGLAGFTGEWQGDRAKSLGYQAYSSVGEVIAYEDNEIESIDGLMSAIYHRFGLLRNDVNEIGFGFVNEGGTVVQNAFVGNNGNSKLAALCADGDSFTSGTYYMLCDPEIRVEASVYEEAKNYYRNLNPELVIWPPANATDVMPVFYEESPDPLPDYSVSGYPISAEFNAVKIDQVEMVSFNIFTQADGQPLDQTRLRLLNKDTDPNGKFSIHQFALFPLDRLDYHTTYRVELSYIQDGVRKDKSWTFTTQKLGTVVYNITAAGDVLPVTSGSTFHVYVPPTQTRPTMGGYRLSYSRGSTVEAKFVDSNTLKITYSGSSGNQASFTLNSGGSFSVTIL